MILEITHYSKKNKNLAGENTSSNNFDHHCIYCKIYNYLFSPLTNPHPQK